MGTAEPQPPAPALSVQKKLETLTWKERHLGFVENLLDQGPTW
jgi:hypothetical protein